MIYTTMKIKKYTSIDISFGSTHLANTAQGRNTTDVRRKCRRVCLAILQLSTSNMAEPKAKANPIPILIIYWTVYAESGFTLAATGGITSNSPIINEIIKPIVVLIKTPIGIPISPLNNAFLIVIIPPHIPKYFFIFGTNLLDTNSFSPFLKLISIVPE